MNEYQMAGVAAVWGAILALIHFGGLWLTIRRLPEARRPRMLFWGSFIIRLGLTLGGFYLTIGMGTWAIFAAFAGFYLTRTVYLHRYSDDVRNLRNQIGN